MDWMSGEGHTGVVRCLQVDDHDQPGGVGVDHDDVEVGDDPFLALKDVNGQSCSYKAFHLQFTFIIL